MTIVAAMALTCGNGLIDKPGKGTVTTVSVEEFAKTIQQKDIWLIDVRTAKEFADGHIAGADNYDVNQADFLDRVKNSPRYNPKKIKVAVYCRSGKRSLRAANILAEQGFTVYNLEGGIMAWQRSRAVTK